MFIQLKPIFRLGTSETTVENYVESVDSIIYITAFSPILCKLKRRKNTKYWHKKPAIFAGFWDNIIYYFRPLFQVNRTA